MAQQAGPHCANLCAEVKTMLELLVSESDKFTGTIWHWYGTKWKMDKENTTGKSLPLKNSPTKNYNPEGQEMPHPKENFS